MSKSYRTQPPRVLVNRKQEIPKITVVERKCLKSDYHPLNKAMIKELIQELPAEYTYGLKAIELLDRNSKKIGQPYAVYREDEKSIIIYSVPKCVWVFESLGQNTRDMYFEHGAEENKDESMVSIQWKTQLDLAYFMFMEVFLHELGHHFVNQYRYRNRAPKGDSANEGLAGLHAERLSKNALFYDIWKNNA
jgi:hypothetical protein